MHRWNNPSACISEVTSEVCSFNLVYENLGDEALNNVTTCSVGVYRHNFCWCDACFYIVKLCDEENGSSCTSHAQCYDCIQCGPELRHIVGGSELRHIVALMDLKAPHEQRTFLHAKVQVES